VDTGLATGKYSLWRYRCRGWTARRLHRSGWATGKGSKVVLTRPSTCAAMSGGPPSVRAMERGNVLFRDAFRRPEGLRLGVRSRSLLVSSIHWWLSVRVSLG